MCDEMLMSSFLRVVYSNRMSYPPCRRCQYLMGQPMTRMTQGLDITVSKKTCPLYMPQNLFMALERDWRARFSSTVGASPLVAIVLQVTSLKSFCYQSGCWRSPELLPKEESRQCHPACGPCKYVSCPRHYDDVAKMSPHVFYYVEQ